MTNGTERKKITCVYSWPQKKNQKIKEVKGGKADTKRSQASDKSKKNANVCAHTGRQVVPMDLWLPWRTRILIVKWEPHPWDEFFTQHLTPSRCLVSVSPSSEGCCPRKHQTKQSDGNYKVTYFSFPFHDKKSRNISIREAKWCKFKNKSLLN